MFTWGHCSTNVFFGSLSSSGSSVSSPATCLHPSTNSFCAVRAVTGTSLWTGSQIWSGLKQSYLQKEEQGLERRSWSGAEIFWWERFKIYQELPEEPRPHFHLLFSYKKFSQLTKAKELSRVQLILQQSLLWVDTQAGGVALAGHEVGNWASFMVHDLWIHFFPSFLWVGKKDSKPDSQKQCVSAGTPDESENGLGWKGP